MKFNRLRVFNPNLTSVSEIWRIVNLTGIIANCDLVFSINNHIFCDIWHNMNYSSLFGNINRLLQSFIRFQIWSLEIIISENKINKKLFRVFWHIEFLFCDQSIRNLVEIYCWSDFRERQRNYFFLLNRVISYILIFN